MAGFFSILKTIIFFSFLAWIVGYISYSASSIVKQPEQMARKANLIVVFTGGEGRVETGLELLAQKYAPNLFISGVHKGVTQENIKSRWTERPALPACCIILDHAAQTTTENAQQTKELAEKRGFSTIRLVTSGYHIHRAMLELERAMPGATIYAHPVPYRKMNIKLADFFSLSFVEYHKFLFRYAGFLEEDHNLPLPAGG